MRASPRSSGKAARDLRWLKEPEENEVDFGSDVDFPASSGGAGTTSVGAGEATAALVGKGAEGDVELQALAPAVEVRSAPSRLKKHLYNVWPSRNRFFCRGFLMTGGETEMGITPNCSVPNLCAWTCILAPCSLYFLWVVPPLWRQGCYAMPTATLAVFLMTAGFLLATCCSDPGIIPRREVIQATNIASRLEAALGYDVLQSQTVPPDGSSGWRNLPNALTSRGYRWCRTCRILRPPRASHCPDCDNCVMRYDHHCPFVNNCVGQRNYHFFFGFVTSVCCLSALVLPVLFWYVGSEDSGVAVDNVQSLSSGALQPVFMVLIAVGCLIGLAAILSFFLWAYHLFLITTRRTTKEFRKSIDNMDEEPTLCAARGPRLFDPWALVDPMDLLRKDEVRKEASGNLCSVCWDV